MAHFMIGDACAVPPGSRTRLFFSSPATIRSIASVKSSIVIESPPRRVATIAASLTRLARSAPVKPGVRRAIASSRDRRQLDP